MTVPEQDLVEVQLIGLPVQVWADAQEHTDGLLREFALLRAGEEETHDVPARLLALVDDLQQRFAGTDEDQRTALFESAAAGEVSLDLTYRTPPAAAQACVDLDRMLDAADEYCRSGQHLLTLATPAEQVAFRKWYLGEFVAQIGGARPTPWPDYQPTA